MRKINKSSVMSLVCAVVLALSLCFVPGTDAKAAAKKPSITKSVTIFRNSGTRVIVVNNMKKTDKIIKVMPKNNDYNAIGAWRGERRDEIVISALNVTKTGDTKVYVHVRRGKTVYKLTMKVKVLKYSNPIASAKIGRTNVRGSISNVMAASLKKDCSGKFSIKAKKGWTITEMSQNTSKGVVKIKNNKTVSTKKGMIFITVKNKKLNQIELLFLGKL